MTPVNWFPGAQSSLSRQVNWGVEPPAGHLSEQSVDAYCVPELEGAVVLSGWRGRPQHHNEEQVFIERLPCTRMVLGFHLYHLT